MILRRAVFLAISVLLAFPAILPAQWRAGAAKVEITPEGPMWMAGYASRTRPAEGKLTELWAKALVLEVAEGKRSLVVTLDLVGIDGTLSRQLCEAIGERHGLKREQIAICTSHTHTGPVVSRNLAPMHYRLLEESQQKLVNEYADSLVKKVLRAVESAMKDMRPAELSWGSGSAGFAVNRRNNKEGEVPRLRAAGELQGPSDHDVPVLAVHDKEGNLKAVLFGYACHCTVLSFYEWSGDYAGFAQLDLETRHPGCVALFWAGCGGDQNPLPRREVELAKKYGGELADAVGRTLEGEMTPLAGSIEQEYREIALPLADLPMHEQLKADASSENKYVAARAEMLLEKLRADGKLAASYPYPVQTWRLGDDVQFIFLGGEVVVDYALRLKGELSGKATWVAGYANDVMAYIPSRRVLREGGYEGGGAMVYYGLPSVWAPEVEALIVEEVRRQLKQR